MELSTSDHFTSKADATGFINVLGTQIKFCTAPTEDDHDYCLLEGALPNAVIVPLHSHLERETFFIIHGRMQGFKDGLWHELSPGQVFDVPGNVQHAFRNTSGDRVSMIAVTTARMGRFFSEVGRPPESVPPGPPSVGEVERFTRTAQAYGYWFASPEENAAIGLNLMPP